MAGTATRASFQNAGETDDLTCGDVEATPQAGFFEKLL
jgi:hypothetical protein